MKGHEKLVVGSITAVAVICWALIAGVGTLGLIRGPLRGQGGLPALELSV